MSRHRYAQNVERDGLLVHAAVLQNIERVAMVIGFSPDDTFVHHPAWLKAQPDAYLERVCAKAHELGAPLLTPKIIRGESNG